MSRAVSLKEELELLLKQKPLLMEELVSLNIVTNKKDRVASVVKTMLAKNIAVMRADGRYSLMNHSYKIMELDAKIAALSKLEDVVREDVSILLKDIKEDLLKFSA